MVVNKNLSFVKEDGTDICVIEVGNNDRIRIDYDLSSNYMHIDTTKIPEDKFQEIINSCKQIKLGWTGQSYSVVSESGAIRIVRNMLNDEVTLSFLIR